MASFDSLVRSVMHAGKNPAEEEEAAATATVEDAISYMEAVKEAFRDHRPATYHEFLRVMDDFRNQSPRMDIDRRSEWRRACKVGIAEVASRVKALFRDSPGLLLGFNAFLPKGYKIQVVGVDELAACFVRDMSLDDDDGH